MTHRTGMFAAIRARALVEPARPESIRHRPNAHWLVVATVCVGAFMGQLDASIVVLAMPTLQQEFHATLAAVEWVALVYLLVLVGLVTAVGSFADMVGRKLLYVYGFVVFTVASALCGLAPSLPALDVFRGLQAVGAAMLQANSVALIATAMPANQLGRGIGVQGAAQALGLSLGPAVGGLLISAGGWRWIFFVNVPVGVIGTFLGWYLLPRSRHLRERHPFDWWGLALFFPAVTGLLLALSSASHRGIASPTVISLSVLTVGFGTAFVWWERRAHAPMIDPALFRSRRFSAGITSGLLSYLVLFGFLFVAPFFLEAARGQTPGRAGVTLAALPVALGLTAPVGGRLADRYGARLPTVGGMFLATCCLLAMPFALDAPSSVFVTLVAALGGGLGAFTPANNAAIMAAAPRRRAGLAGGVLNMTRGIGTSLGVAVTGLVFEAVAGGNALHAGDAAAVRRGFVASVLVLAAASGASMALAALRGTPRRFRETRPVALPE